MNIEEQLNSSINTVIRKHIKNANAKLKDLEDKRKARIFGDAINLTKMPKHVMIIGCGGIGSWVSIIIGTSSMLDRLYLFDPDEIEESNLNRTIFGIDDIGFTKVDSISSIIIKNNPTLDLVPVSDYFNENSLACIFTESMSFQENEDILVIDCRDNDYQDYNLLDVYKGRYFKDYKVLRAAYNETSVTLDFSPVGRVVWGAGGYTTQPSHPLPSFMAAMLVCCAAFLRDNYRDTVIEDIPITFDVRSFFDFLFTGMITHKISERNENMSNLLTILKHIDYNEFTVQGETA